MNTSPSIDSPSQHEIRMTRVFDASRDLVFEVTTNPLHVPSWWGCSESTMPVCEIDLRVGGTWHYVMRTTDGQEYRFKGVYREIVRPERIVYTQVYDMEPWQNDEALVTILFEEKDGKTTLTSVIRFASPESYTGAVNSGMEAGMELAFDRLNEVLRSLTEGVTDDQSQSKGEAKSFILTRVLNAPRDLVYQAWTQSEHLMQWWGPKGFTVSKADLDLRPEGTLHYCLQSPNGQEMWGKWTFMEVSPPEQIVFLAAFSNAQGDVVRAPFSDTWPLQVLSAITFTENDGKTTLTMTGKPWNATNTERKTFESAIPSMNGGWTGTLDQLAAYLSGVKSN